MLDLLALGDHPEHIAHGVDDHIGAIGREVVVAGAGNDALLAACRETAQIGLLGQPALTPAFGG